MKTPSDYIDALTLSELQPDVPRTRSRGMEDSSLEATPVPIGPAVVNGSSLVSFVAGLTEDEMRDVLYCVQLAQRGASGAFNRFTQTTDWYGKYVEILEMTGWAGEQFAFTEYSQSSGHLEMDQAALEVMAAIATGQQLQMLTKSLDALRKLASGDRPITLFELNALTQGSGNFQIGTVQKATANSALSMGLGAFYFTADRQEHKFLFFQWGERETRFWTGVQKLTLNEELYAPHRAQIVQKLGIQAGAYISALSLVP